MNTQYFKYIIEVDKTRSITQAAENLFIAQPNLSKAIREAEYSLGFEIFKRTSKGVVPTQKGEALIELARKIIKQLDEIENLNKKSEDKGLTLGIAIPRSSYIADGVTKFIAGLDTDSGLDINIHETNSVQTVKDVIDGDCSLGVIRFKNEYENYFMDYLAANDLQGDLLWEFDYVALMSENDPLAKVDRVSAEDIRNYIEIVHGDNIIPYMSANSKTDTTENKTPEKRICLYERCNQFEILSHVKKTYMWVSPIPTKILSRYGLVQRKCDIPGNKCKDILISRKGQKFSEIEIKLIDKLYESKNKVAFNEYL